LKMLKHRIFILETKRQLVHLGLGLTISVVVYNLMPVIGYLLLIPLFTAPILLYIIPKKWPKMKIANHLIIHFERDNDALKFPFKGSIWYGVGILPPILLSLADIIPLEVACAIIAVLSVGDSTSTWFGKFFGRIRFGHKSLEGFLAFFIFSSLSVLLFVPNYQLALILGFSGALLEFFTFIDDNLLIPIGLSILYILLNIITPNLII
jgi:dolichol kinase